ncbi:hypothetical protein AQ505_08215 [Pedobacter sp. PACM 27299]|uniref:hypothetical protein n=1 Tax=Pedobacter sp. PACM 27299 TaxID=1727164 RepID=UPI000706E4AC|nr:hypothetical protein [Pedobacter sp. PACM 27299]ALL05477.1 hypothetical protein AQ505_08215 [Pedobacter sp. PACM 27299]
MNNSIGEYLRLKLRSRNISNKEAGASIGLSESAFEKVLMQDDIYASRLVKLSELLKENLLEYYYKIEPIKSLILVEKNEHKSALRNLSDKIELQKQVIDSKEELLMTQRKYILELETRLKK